MSPIGYMTKEVKLMCIPHAEGSIKRAFVGQKILIDTKIRQPGKILRCEYYNGNLKQRCMQVAAVKVIIFSQTGEQPNL
jgi:hypothetical protein